MKFHSRIYGILSSNRSSSSCNSSLLVASAGGLVVSLFQSQLLLTSFAGNAHHLKKEKKARFNFYFIHWTQVPSKLALSLPCKCKCDHLGKKYEWLNVTATSTSSGSTCRGSIVITGPGSFSFQLWSSVEKVWINDWMFTLQLLQHEVVK